MTSKEEPMNTIKPITIPVELELTPRSRALMDALYKALDTHLQAPEPQQQQPASSVPLIGEYWVGQGGIYAGVARGRDGQPDYHLILATEVPNQDFTWQAAMGHAKTIEADGHADFAVPTRWESALLYANLQDKQATDHLFWTSTQHSMGTAWYQDFDDGSQNEDRKISEFRVYFVRRVPFKSQDHDHD